MMFDEMAQCRLYPPLYRESELAAGDLLSVVLLRDSKPPLWDAVSDWIDRNGPIGNSVVCRLGGVGTQSAFRFRSSGLNWDSWSLYPVEAGETWHTRSAFGPRTCRLFSALRENNAPRGRYLPPTQRLANGVVLSAPARFAVNVREARM
jgi:hypothetical protein